MQTEACSRSAERAAERDSHQPLVPFILISEMHSHSFLSPALPPLLESVTLMSLKVTSDTLWDTS